MTAYAAEVVAAVPNVRHDISYVGFKEIHAAPEWLWSSGAL